MGEIKIVSSGKSPAVIDQQRCSGCGRCIAACPEKLYTLEVSSLRKHAVNRSPDKCTRCGRCILSCPLEIIAEQADLL
jgi:NAD-dependent dihydropyrimidine dehydrogenase PreA subunit